VPGELADSSGDVQRGASLSLWELPRSAGDWGQVWEEVLHVLRLQAQVSLDYYW